MSRVEASSCTRCVTSANTSSHEMPLAAERFKPLVFVFVLQYSSRHFNMLERQEKGILTENLKIL